MKHIKITIILALICSQGIAQSKEHKIQHSNGTLSIIGINDVRVTGYDGNEIILSTDDYDEEVDDRAAGLKLVNSLGLTDNSGMGLAIKTENGDVIVTQVSSSCDGEYAIKVPRGMMIEYEHRATGGGDIMLEYINKEIIISTTYGDVRLEDIEGPMAVKSVYGSIDANFSTVSQEGSISLESVYDHVDITIPASTKADISLRTPYGEIYSNVDIDVASTDGMRRVSSKTVKGTINGGGVDMSIRASYDNIYLRKK